MQASQKFWQRWTKACAVVDIHATVSNEPSNGTVVLRFYRDDRKGHSLTVMSPIEAEELAAQLVSVATRLRERQNQGSL